MNEETEAGGKNWRGRISRLLLVAMALLCAAPGYCAETGSSGKEVRPNVVLITINSFRYAHAGFNGFQRPTTPAMDKFAERSFVFKRAFTQGGYTMPAMMTLFTSLHPESHNVFDAFKDKLSSGVRTLAEIFNEQGYQTAGFWELYCEHLALSAGFGRGFDLVSNLNPDFRGRDAVFDWIRANKDKPFFLALNTRSTHPPLLPLPKYRDLLLEGKRGRILDTVGEWERETYRNVILEISTPGRSLYGTIDPGKLEDNKADLEGRHSPQKMERIESLIPPKFRHRLGAFMMSHYFRQVDTEDKENIKYLRSLYDACLLGVDQELIRPILDLLEGLGLRNGTIVIITADHGTLLGEHGGHFGPGIDFYEEIVHVPLLIGGPWISKRKDIDGLVQSADLMPTILELAGIPVPSLAQGRSLVPLMNGGDNAASGAAIFASNHVRAFIRTPDWKLIALREHLDRPRSEQDELFDLSTDPEEKVNLRDTRIDIYRSLRTRIRDHLASVQRHVDGIYTFPDHIDAPTRKKIRDTGYW